MIFKKLCVPPAAGVSIEAPRKIVAIRVRCGLLLPKVLSRAFILTVVFFTLYEHMKSFFAALKSHFRLSSPLLHCIFLLILTYVLFYQTFYNEWTIDDFPVLIHNPDIKSLSGFFNDTYPGRPLRELTLLLDFVFFGDNPFGYHFQHLFWHGLNAILVYLLARKLFSSSLLALLGAVLFLAHPLNVEVVANISNRKDSLSLVFSLLSVLAFGGAHQSSKNRRLVLFFGSIFLYLVACHAKQNAFLLPVLWLAYEYRFIPPGQRLLARLSPIKSLMILFGLGCTAYIAKLISFGGIGKLQQQAWAVINQNNFHAKPDLIDYIRLLLKAWGTMLQKIVWPVNLAPEYAVPATDIDDFNAVCDTDRVRCRDMDDFDAVFDTDRVRFREIDDQIVVIICMPGSVLINLLLFVFLLCNNCAGSLREVVCKEV